jgi:hypothetical protein
MFIAWHDTCFFAFIKIPVSNLANLYAMASLKGKGVMVLVFNATFNNNSVILWRSVLLVEETVVPGENH